MAHHAISASSDDYLLTVWIGYCTTGWQPGQALHCLSLKVSWDKRASSTKNGWMDGFGALFCRGQLDPVLVILQMCRSVKGRPVPLWEWPKLASLMTNRSSSFFPFKCGELESLKHICAMKWALGDSPSLPIILVLPFALSLDREIKNIQYNIV